MRPIGAISDEAQAKRFGDHLLSNGIPCDIDDDDSGTWTVWIHDDDQIEKAEAELIQFNREPDNPITVKPNPRQIKYAAAKPRRTNWRPNGRWTYEHRYSDQNPQFDPI